MALVASPLASACTSQQPATSVEKSLEQEAPPSPHLAVPATSSVPPVVLAGRQLSFEGEVFLVDDFEDGSLEHALGGRWSTSFDSHGLGTTLSPSPLEVHQAGAQGSLHALGIAGHFGKNQQPWPYADLRASFSSTDLSSFAAVRFWVRGNGKEYVLAIVRETVTDYAHYRSEFVASKEWTQVELPLKSFHQPDWGIQVEEDWRDATAFSFQPSATLNDEAYELMVDKIELLAP